MSQLTLILPLSRSDEMIRDWVTELSTTPAITGIPIIITHDSTKSHLIPEIESRLDPVATVELDTPDPTQPSQAHLQVLSSVSTRYAAVASVPRRAGIAVRVLLNNLRTQLETIDERTKDIPLSPVLLPTGQRQPVWFRSYLAQHRDVLSRAPEYFGALAVHAGSHTLEAVDPGRDGQGQIVLRGRLALGRYNLDQAPPWSLRIAIADQDGHPIVTGPATVSQRVDSRGVHRWENLTAELDISHIPNGNYTVQTVLEGTTGLSADMTPSPGVLANARTRIIRGPQTSTVYLVHTTAQARRSWLTIHQGEPATIARAWEWSLICKDLRALLRDRPAGRLRIARIIRLLTRPFFRNREIWLIGEREDTAQDNGMHLFRHLRSTGRRPDVYYILEKDSPHMERVGDLGNVITHSSLKHRLFMLHATVVANAYSIKHMIPHQWHPNSYSRYLAWRVGALRVYLKHGVHMATNAVKRGTGGYDLYLTVSPGETAAFRADSGYDEQLVETGLPRYDALHPTPSSRRILFMPTWRRYLVPKLFGDEDEALVPFHGSTYEDFLTSFLNSPVLHDMLERHDFTLQFLPHYNVRELLAELPTTHPRVGFADTSVQTFTELLTGCDVFITDYSSVHFDVAFVGTPIIYTHFDREEYSRGHAAISWFEYERDGFGPVTTSLDETLAVLEQVLDDGGRVDRHYARRVRRAFSFHDHNNCGRVTDAIDGLVASLSREYRGTP